MRRTDLDPRLSSAAEYVRQGAVFADIGTDHAYLPVFLLEEGRISRAYAADIAQGPLSRAESTVRAHGRMADVTLVLTDGLRGMENYGITDIAICGMGGENIVSILENAPFVKDPAVRLILQPMTRPSVVRHYLAEGGFAVLDETYCRDRDKLYTVIAAAYTGERYALTRAEAELGKTGLHAPTPLFAERVRRAITAQRRKLDGLRLGGTENSEEEEYLAFLEKWMENYDSTGASTAR